MIKKEPDVWEVNQGESWPQRSFPLCFLSFFFFSPLKIDLMLFKLEMFSIFLFAFLSVKWR